MSVNASSGIVRYVREVWTVADLRAVVTAVTAYDDVDAVLLTSAGPASVGGVIEVVRAL